MVKPYYEDSMVTIYHGDCREVLPQLSGVNLAITSPRYNCGMAYGTCDDSTSLQEYWAETEDWFYLLAQSLRSGGYAAVNIPNWIGSREEQVYAPEEFRAIFGRHLGFLDELIWVKGPAKGAAWGDYPTSPRIRANHEYVLIYRSGEFGRVHNSISWDDWSRLTVSVWSIQASLPMSSLHPATFPVELPARLIRLYCPDGGLVLDPFKGSGTTLRAAKDLGRRAVGIEIEERYCEVATNRLTQEVFSFEETA